MISPLPFAPEWIERLLNEVEVSTSRSSGPGGQNVNKVNTRVSLTFHIGNSAVLTEEQKQLIHLKWATKISNEGYLQVHAQEKRSQLANKELAIKKLLELLTKAFTKKKKRKSTAPTRASKEKRLKGKKVRGEVKQQRSTKWSI
jgi:ribosome-associated protein